MYLIILFIKPTTIAAGHSLNNPSSVQYRRHQDCINRDYPPAEMYGQRTPQRASRSGNNGASPADSELTAPYSTAHFRRSRGPTTSRETRPKGTPAYTTRASGVTSRMPPGWYSELRHAAADNASYGSDTAARNATRKRGNESNDSVSEFDDDERKPAAKKKRSKN